MWDFMRFHSDWGCGLPLIHRWMYNSQGNRIASIGRMSPRLSMIPHVFYPA